MPCWRCRAGSSRSSCAEGKTIETEPDGPTELRLQADQRSGSILRRSALLASGWANRSSVLLQQRGDAVLIRRRPGLAAAATCKAHFDAITPLDPEVGRQQGDGRGRAVGESFPEFHVHPGGAGSIVWRALPVDINTQILFDENALDDTLVDTAV